MKTTITCALPLLLAGFILSTGVQAQELLGQRTGVSFPAEVQGFTRLGETDYEAKNPLAGTGLRFESPMKFRATLYAYKLDVTPFPGSITDAAAAAEREQVVQTILTISKGPNPSAPAANSRRNMSGLTQSKNHPGIPIAVDGFIVYPDGMAANSLLFMWVARSHMWKLRIDRVPGPHPDSPMPFAMSIIDTTLEK